MREAGDTFAEIGAVLSVRWATVHNWCRRYEAGGVETLGAKRRGRRVGTHRTLTPTQERTIQRLVTGKTPDQLEMPFALWSRAAIAARAKAKDAEIQWGEETSLSTTPVATILDATRLTALDSFELIVRVNPGASYLTPDCMTDGPWEFSDKYRSPTISAAMDARHHSLKE